MAAPTAKPILFMCDMQTKFVSAIHEFGHVSKTCSKLLKASGILGWEVVYTTQLRAKLGDTVDELKLQDGRKPLLDMDKTLFSMAIPEVLAKLPARSQIIIVGIESHICVTQTTLDLIAHGHEVFVISDGVSSCNASEVPIALRRLAAAGATVTTSESFIYQAVRDAGIPEFKQIAALVKETKEATAAAMKTLPGCSI
ncbi:Isochorismatase-like protein [Protomyces lactucae-debilis]|uniref:Isochorismatase-like protein n=1 Tax=Protomyces lactucae-debilis TaxID=2754530 RepID=A0A1Y2FNV0_PROLT|nr:Isochorismatase-like protein [Protomyces lactucae-debilis]ORY85004.1 Isochorismatase-like protein [Protomyces lactucae-debilis]